MEMLSAVDAPMFDKVNAIGGVIVLVMTYALGDHWYLFAAFLLCNVIDYITGVMKSHVYKNESSSAGLKGIIKKFSYWLMVIIAFLMGSVIAEIGEMAGQDLSMFTPAIGWLTLASLGINEFRSIMENLVQLGVPVPRFLVSGLAEAQDKLEKAGDAIFDGKLDIKHDAEDDDDRYHVAITTPQDELERKASVTLKIHTIKEEE